MKHVPIRLRPVTGLLLLLASVLAASSGCSRKALEGVVVTVRGETLPGVAVAIKGTDFQAVTDGVGQYRLPAIAGTHAITFSKTGYTPGLLELTIDQPRPVTATTVSLWPLPESKSIYLFENFRYTRTDVLTPGPWSSKRDSTIIYGVKRDIEASTTNPQPMIVCYNKAMPSEVKLSRLEQVAVEPGIGQSSDKAIRIWSPVEDYPVTCEAIDAPAEELRRLALQGPLPPGAYAIHWGGLTGGQTNEEQRIFCFRIVDPNAPPPAEEPAPAKDNESPKEEAPPVPPEEPSENSTALEG